MTRKLDASDFLVATALHRYVPVEELLHLKSTFTDRLAACDYPYSLLGAATYLDQLEAQGFGRDAAGSVDQLVFERLLLRDFRQSLAALDDAQRSAIASSADFAALANRLLKSIKSEFLSHGMQPPEGAIRFVEHFPAPFADRNYMALTLDAGDLKAHGVEPGVYLAERLVVPVFTEPLILHEYIHVGFGERDPNLLCRGLEEGVCELLGSLYLGAKAVGVAAACNCFMYSRIRARQPELWSTYLQFTRQALTVYRRHGMAGIFALVRGGRALLKEIERLLWERRQDRLDLPASDVDTDFLAYAEWLTDVIARQMSVSPTAYHVMQFAHTGSTVREVAAQAGLPHETVLQALEELSGYPRLVTLRADKAVISFAEDIHGFPPQFLRYRVPTELH